MTDAKAPAEPPSAIEQIAADYADDGPATVIRLMLDGQSEADIADVLREIRAFIAELP